MDFSTVAPEDQRLGLQTVERKITVNLKFKTQPKYHSRVNILKKTFSDKDGENYY